MNPIEDDYNITIFIISITCHIFNTVVRTSNRPLKQFGNERYYFLMWCTYELFKNNKYFEDFFCTET